MAASVVNLFLWTSDGMKEQLRTLLKLSKFGTRSRLTTWQKQREQIMDWVSLHASELQTLPEGLGLLTARLISSELFTVDSAGVLKLDTWPEVAGAWAARKAAEAEKFGEVSAWAQALLALVAPAPTGASLESTAGGAGASGSGGAAALSSAGALTGGGAIGCWGGSRWRRFCRDGPREFGHRFAFAAEVNPNASAAALASSAPTTAVDPNVIAAAIAVALGAKLDAFGERLSTLEAQGSAAGGAGLHGGGAVPVEAARLQNAIRDSIATVEDWDISRCAQACTDLIHETARYVLPELRAEECELDELPAGREATVEHWRAFVHLLQARVGEFQRFVKSQVPSFIISDVMVSSFFTKRKRGTFEDDEEEARAAGGGRGLVPPLDATRRDCLATLGEGFRTVNEEQLARALRGELAQEDVARLAGAGPSLTAMPSRGPLAGIDLLVSPVKRLQQEDEGRLKLKDGELTVVAKKNKCKDFDEWERGFLRILCEAPVEARDDLADFMAWARTIAAEFSFFHFNEFYEHLMRQVQRSSAGISLDGYDRVWQVYKQQHNLQPKGVKAKPREGVPVVAPDPMVDADAALELEEPMVVQAAGAVDAQVGCGPPDVEDDGGVPQVPPGGADVPGGWWKDLRADEFVPVWDVLGGPRRHDRAPMA
ncbi:hypothetical protein CYMTET_46761 [Cymbomonas tetramitiformis]|uniref:Uncharacterized protein n=1 Tax=Cymbomonas tetramitiformis TaxID=36881 RepID=A0AAE0EWS9_9CHLO|nr:hypothetical protein CYMTET_46761 [Cymbomonas tetramitiformis]